MKGWTAQVREKLELSKPMEKIIFWKQLNNSESLKAKKRDWLKQKSTDVL